MSAPAARIALLDDEARLVEILAMVLRREGYEVHGFTDPMAALAAIESRDFDLLVTDLKMPGADGLEVLRRARKTSPELPVILITAHATVPTAVAALREGAFDYVQKPFDNEELRALVKRALEVTRLARENRYLRAELRTRYSLDAVVAESPRMREALELARRAAASRSTVLVTGESGTGKELVARAVHYHSERVGGAFVAVNCKALAPGVLESELFGHERGAFTGAERARPGLFERADGGTLFLDEIGEVEPDFQSKLLRVLQERRVQRVGGSEEKPIDVRIVAATNRDLRAEIAAGRFREDLYFRLAVIPIQLPPLRERREDVLPLAVHFLARWNRELSRSVAGWTPEVERWLLAHDWPGNVRELENAIERGVVLARGDRIGFDDLLVDAPGEEPRADAASDGTGGASLQEFLDAAAAERIRRVLEQTAGKRVEAARRLGIDRATLYRLMRRYGITDRGARWMFMSVRLASSDREIAACFPVMHQLRPHLTPDAFLARVRSQEQAGYRLAYVEVDGRPVAVAGFRISESLASGRFLYVDDLVTLDAERSKGRGAELLGWLLDHARTEGCQELELDSGVQRKDAHRFYEREGLKIRSYHFEIGVGDRRR